MKLDAYSSIYRAVYDFHKRHMPCPVTLEEWEAATEDITAVSNKCGNDKFAMDMLVAVYNELERQYKIIKGGTDADADNGSM